MTLNKGKGPGAGGGGVDPTFTTLTEGQVPKADASGALVFGGATVDPGTLEWTFDESINVPAGSLKLGTNIVISDFGESVGAFNNATSIQFMGTGNTVSETVGILNELPPKAPPLEQFLVTTVDADTSEEFTIANPIEFVLDPSIFSSSIPTTEFLVIENTNDFASVPPSGQFRNQIYIGTDDTGFKIFDEVFDISVGLTKLAPPNPQTFRVGETYFSRTFPVGTGSFTLKGEQVNPSVFVAKADIKGFAVQRNENSTADNVMGHIGLTPYARLNSSYTTAVGVTSGVAVTIEGTATTDTVTGGPFVVGVASTSNPTVVTDGSATFAQDNIVQISDTRNNNNYYEVESHVGTLLTVRGIGTVATVEDFTGVDFFPETDDAVITKVEVSVIRSNTSGDWETAKGSVTPLVYTTLGEGSYLGDFDANDATFPSSNPAVANSRNAHPILAFDDATAESVVFHGVISTDYSDGDVSVNIDWVAETATTGDVVWGIEIERIDQGVTDIDSDSFAAQQTGTDTTSGTSGIVTRTTITLTQAQADSWTTGDAFRLRVQRVAASGSDTMTNDAEVLRVSLEQ